MNTALSRLNAVFAFSLSVLASLTFLCFLSTAFVDKTSSPSISVHPEVILRGAHDFGLDLKDLATLKFDLGANLSSLFDWNTKQLFVLVTAHYRTRNNVRVTVVDVLPVTHPLPQPRNQVVLWDRIIRRGDSAILDLRSAATKYNFFDDGRGLKGNQNMTLQVSWNVVPIAGRLPLIWSSQYSLPFPNSY
ncbi:Signal peptidase complex subunit 3 [Geodia barretti]|uniref:Signal peptidase complex subunit 3 n=1 Tax=Geodia barretti TaxID=519541 RepID=A0AA35TFI2_GEOBA|nr:Signal peptidase complex subunit 3 [Geodia barretti]